METEDFRENWLRGELVSRHLKRRGERLVILPLAKPIKNTEPFEYEGHSYELREGDP